MTYFVGLDVSKDETAICARDEMGQVVLKAKSPTEPDAIAACLATLDQPPQCVILETGRTSNWLHGALVGLGLRAVCVDARQAHAILNQMANKTDANDAAMLAELARTGFYRQVAVKSRAAQEKRTLLQARALMIRQRQDVDNTVRGLLASLGLKLPKLRQRFPDRAAAAVEDRPELQAIIQPLLRAREGMVLALARLDRQLVQEVRSDPHSRRLMTVPGVGAVTAFAFVATIDDPSRFRSSRAVGAYLGLTPRRYQSGERDVSGRISKRGDATMRTLLYEAAMSLITRVRPSAGGPLQAWAHALRDRVGHKKACVALARRIGVLLHRMWMDGSTFEHRPGQPLPN
jgi:transposase|tara:strand:- start:279 stop:1316 length:1038 start_codon:yes stop_codon:yes gene_type:complete